MTKQLTILIALTLYFVPVLSQSTWTYYNNSSGLTSNSISCITDDKFDNIWVGLSTGTSSGYGLDKFDGQTWTNYDTTNSDLKDNRVWNLISDTNGVLWIGYLYDEGLTRFDGTTWTTYTTSNSGILSNFIGDFYVDEKNILWILSGLGISKFDGLIFTNYPITFPPNLLASAFLVEDSGSVWFATRGLMHYNLITGSSVLYDETNSNIPSIYSSCIGRDTSGLIWLGFNFGYNGGLGTGGTNGGLATFDGSTFTTVWPFYSVGTGVYGMRLDASNNVWVSTRCEGLYKFDGNSWTQIPEIPTTSCSFDVHIDRKNNVWYSSIMSSATSGLWTNRLPLGIDEHSSKNALTVFPNPASEELNIDISTQGSPKIKIEIYNSIGSLVYSQKSNLNSQERREVIDIRSFSAGLYFLAIESDGELLSKRFVVAH